MSQINILDIEGSHPQIPTSFITDDGTAIPLANTLELIGGEGIETSGSGSTITVSGENATAGVNVGAANKGIAAFDSSDFTVVDGFVQITGSFGGILNILTDDGIPSVEPDGSGQVEILGGNGINVTGQGPGNTVTIAIDSPLSVIYGGTGVNTITDHALIVGSGAAPVTMIGPLTDGQLAIGSTGADPIAANLTSPDGSITITNGAGSIILSSLGTSSLDQDQIYYVGKHGNDANSGLNIDEAVLTFGQALTLAAAATPGAANRFVIACLDDGIYTENISCVEYVDIFAPNAKLVGSITGVDNVTLKFRGQDVATGTVGITKTVGTGYMFVDIDVITATGTGIGLISTSGFTSLTWKAMYVENGFGIGDLTAANAHMHMKGGDIYITGTGAAIARANAGSTVGRLDHIIDIGGGNGTGITIIAGEIDVVISRIQDCALALNTDGGTANITAQSIDCTAAYDVAAAGTLNLIVNSLSGTETNAGTLNLISQKIRLQLTDYANDIGYIAYGNRVMLSSYGTGNAFGGGAGNKTLTTATATLNTAFGVDTLDALTSGTKNTVIGTLAASNITEGGDNTAIGYNALNTLTTALYNTAVGSECLVNSNANLNTAVGWAACRLTSSGELNVGIGPRALENNSTGQYNIAIGGNSIEVKTTGDANVAIGRNSLVALATGANNTAIGHSAGQNLTTNDSNNILINNLGTAGDNGKTIIGTPGTQTSCYIAGIQGVSVSNAQAVQIDTTTGQVGSVAGTAYLAYEEITDATKTIVNNYEYGANRAGGVAFALPATAAAGTRFAITGIQGNWSLTQASGQSVKFGNTATTTGAGGSLTATDAGDCIMFTCIVANTTWRETRSVGNITIV